MMKDPKFLNFDQAVQLSELLVNYSNSTEGKEALITIGKAFDDMKIKQNYHVKVRLYERNCPECSGCTDEGCILGCFKTPPDDVCYWDKALEEIIGTKLVTHEIAHVWYDQAYLHNGLSKEEKFEQSERFAQFVENNFTHNLVWCGECKQFEVLANAAHNLTIKEGSSRIVDGLLFGIGLAVSGALVAWAISRASKRNVDFINRTKGSDN